MKPLSRRACSPTRHDVGLMARPCQIEGCERPVVARGYCNRDYLRWRNAGGRTAPRPEPWTPAEVKILLAATLTPHTDRWAGPDPENSLAAVGARLGRTEAACRSKRVKLERERGHKTGQKWTKDGLWTAREDRVIRDHMTPPGIRAPHGTWPMVGEYLGRTAAACRTRACALRK